ncbi:MAG: leucine-rich repeat domain-containing protein [Treponema sp.]|nr:leucine-rich repeat domain-containing protein [Treponema sp.]
MNGTNYITDLTLELYHHDALTNKERKLVEAAMTVDSELYSRYEALKKSYQEIQNQYFGEKKPVFTVIRNIDAGASRKFDRTRNNKLMLGIGIAAVFLCVFGFSLIYFTGNNTANTIAEETVIKEDDEITNEITEKIVIIPDEVREPIQRLNNVTPNESIGGTSIAALPDSPSGVYVRGGSGTNEQSSITIPDGVSFIFDSMFANRQLTAVTIPDRVVFIGDSAFENNLLSRIIIPANVYSIGSKAFANNPLIRITIGENVTIDNDAIPGNFAEVYNNSGKTAGTYIRLNTNSNEWVKQ